MIPVIVISLISATERRSRIRKSLESLDIPFRFFDAINGSEMSRDEVAELKPRKYAGQYGRELTAGEIGCAASFRSVLQSIEKDGEEFICVAEDDAIFSRETLQFLNKEFLISLPKFDVLRLHNDHRAGTKGLAHAIATTNTFTFFAPLKPRLFAIAQIFSRAGASKILKGISPLATPFDNLIYRDSRITGLRVLEIRPPVVTARETPSTIGGRALPQRNIRSIFEHNAFIFARNIRSVFNFIKAWGFRALLNLKYYS